MLTCQNHHVSKMFRHVPLTCSRKFRYGRVMPPELPPTELQRVGATLRHFRELRGFKPDQFASEIGISRPYLANIEAGRRPLSNVLLARAATALNIQQIAIMLPEAVEQVSA